MRATAYKRHSYYRDTSSERQLPCEAGGGLSVSGPNLVGQFGRLLASLALPASWRGAIAERSKVLASHDEGGQRIVARRAELEAEQERLVTAFTKGYLTEQVLDAQIERIRGELQALPPQVMRSAAASMKAILAAGETLEDMASYWEEALPGERRDIVWALLTVGGLVFDLERQTIVGLLPRGDMLPVLALGLAERWEQRGDELWFREAFLPAKLARDARPRRATRALTAQALPGPGPGGGGDDRRGHVAARHRQGLWRLADGGVADAAPRKRNTTRQYDWGWRLDETGEV